MKLVGTPRWRTPVGVVLRIAAADEVLRPVLMCAVCNAPTLHTRHGDGVCFCATCYKERRW